MRINHPEWAGWTHRAAKCLNIGTHCTLCAQSALPDIDLCHSCLQLFKTLKHTNREGLTTILCPGCGLEHVSTSPLLVLKSSSSVSTADGESVVTAGEPIIAGDFCSECTGGQGRFLRHIVAPFRYAHPVDNLIKRIKYREDRQLTRVLGTLLADAVISNGARELPHMILPMPLHPSRLRHRGFNQARDIACWSGKRLGVEVVTDQVSRIVDTGSLAGLNRQERQHRILGAFRAGNALADKRVAIVDDVLTTGASARELAREIYDSGAESVELWVLARTSSSREGA